MADPPAADYLLLGPLPLQPMESRRRSNDGDAGVAPRVSVVATSPMSASGKSDAAERVIVPWPWQETQVSSCCADERPFSFTQLPRELAARGVDEAAWDAFMGQKLRAVREAQLSEGAFCLLMPTLVCIPVAIYLADAHDRRLNAWAESFNREVLEPRGLYGRVQGPGQELNIWLAVATTPGEIERLKAESYTGAEAPLPEGQSPPPAAAACGCCLGERANPVSQKPIAAWNVWPDS